MYCYKGYQKSSWTIQNTILVCSNTVGTILPPMFIFKGERVNYEWTKRKILNTCTIYGMSPQGWIDHELLLSDFLSYWSRIYHKLDQCCCFWMGIHLTIHQRLSKLQLRMKFFFFVCHPVQLMWANHLMLFLDY